MLRRIVLGMLVAFSMLGVALAQEAETQGEIREKVTKEVLAMEEEKRQCFLSTTSSNNYCADWIKNHDADGIIHFTGGGGNPRLRTKTELMGELAGGQRKLYKNDQYGHVVHVYGDGGDGTLAIVTYKIDGEIELYGKRSPNRNFAIDAWQKVDGKWWFILHSTHFRNHEVK